ncbi:MAG: hemolysin III family protein [Coriobacteriia bacterium]
MIAGNDPTAPDTGRSRRSGASGYTLGEEIAASVTHGVGVAAAITALVLLVAFAFARGTTTHVISVAVYGSTLVLLYTASTLYHSVTHERAKHVLKVIDHASIYMLIAGTYTPFTLVTLRGVWGWSLFGTVWGLALVGVLLEGFWVWRPKWVSALVYLGMGWLVVVAIRPLVATLPRAGVAWLVAGGLAYTLGTVFYVMKRVPYMHAVWHLWVLAGSACHVVAVLFYVLPR